MTKTVLKGTRMDETDYQKGFQRDINKLSNEINKNYILSAFCYYIYRCDQRPTNH